MQISLGDFLTALVRSFLFLRARTFALNVLITNLFGSSIEVYLIFCTIHIQILQRFSIYFSCQVNIKNRKGQEKEIVYRNKGENI